MLEQNRRIQQEVNRNSWWTTNGKAGLKDRIAGLVPDYPFLLMRNIRNRLKLLRAFLSDYHQFARFSSAVHRGDNNPKLAGLITMAYHNIEKGLSLPEPRPMFGRAKIRTLVNRMHRSLLANGWDETTTTAFRVLEAYLAFNASKGQEDPELKQRMDALTGTFGPPIASCSAGGTKRMERDEFLRKSQIDLKDFFLSRSSIRNFSQDPVGRDAVENAVRMAQKTPSVCNRQTGRVMLFDDRATVQKLLALHGGARGFSETVPMLLIISSDTSRLQSASERYQAWIDGGLFAMSVIYALHSLGLGSCCLNWSRMPKEDAALTRLLPELAGHRIILFIAVGHPKESINVPISTSPPLAEVLRIGPKL